MRDNIDLIVDKLLKEKMTPEKIKAFGTVIESLIPDKKVSSEPNSLKEEVENSSEFTEDVPLDFSTVEGVEVEGVKGSRKKIKIIPAQKV